MDTWIKYYNKNIKKDAVVILGSPGLRSVGSLVIKKLIDTFNPEIIGEIYSTHFPLIYQTVPSYASDPECPGVSGVEFKSNKINFPKIQIYYASLHNIILVEGYHANFEGQYEVAEKVLNFLQDLKVKQIIVIAGYGMQGDDVCCAATNLQKIQEMKEKYSINVNFSGPFFGFSGVVFGISKMKGIEAISLFGKTKSIPEKPEHPDEEAANKILEKLNLILNLKGKKNNR